MSKKRYLTLLEAIQTNKIRIGDVIDYQPQNSLIYLKETETGAESKLYETEELKYQIAYLDSDEKVVIVSEPTKLEIMLKGNIGYNNVEMVSKKLCARLFSDREMGIEADCMSKEIFVKIPAKLHAKDKLYLLGSPFARISETNEFLGLHYVYNGQLRTFYLSGTYGKESHISASVRVVVYLPSDILVDVSNHKYDNQNKCAIWKI